jgi:hypothetical protein
VAEGNSPNINLQGPARYPIRSTESRSHASISYDEREAAFWYPAPFVVATARAGGEITWASRRPCVSP